jgi:hypothetical protein
MSRRRATNDDPLAGLPEDPSIDALDSSVREGLGRQWANRATAELRVASVFSVVARGLFETGADPQVLRIAARAVSDEVRHAEICNHLAERYLGCSVAWPKPGPVPIPRLRRAPHALRPTLHAVAMGCVNETIASAWLEKSLRETTSPLVRAALRELIADDIHHARLGWAHVASSFVSSKMRRELGTWLPLLLEAAAGGWLRDTKETLVEGHPAHGVPSLATTRDVVRETVLGVVLPGFDELGVPTAAGREWCAERFRGSSTGP